MLKRNNSGFRARRGSKTFRNESHSRSQRRPESGGLGSEGVKGIQTSEFFCSLSRIWVKVLKGSESEWGQRSSGAIFERGSETSKDYSSKGGQIISTVNVRL